MVAFDRHIIHCCCRVVRLVLTNADNSPKPLLLPEPAGMVEWRGVEVILPARLSSAANTWRCSTAHSQPCVSRSKLYNTRALLNFCQGCTVWFCNSSAAAGCASPYACHPQSPKPWQCGVRALQCRQTHEGMPGAHSRPRRPPTCRLML
jgi:hypothetical protein